MPGSYRYLKRWHFVLIVAGAWLVAAVVGLGLYYWWFHSVDKTPAVFVVLIYLVVCTVGSLLTAMVQDKPLVSAAGDRADVGAVRGGRRRRGATRCLLLRSSGPLPGGLDPLLGLAG